MQKQSMLICRFHHPNILSPGTCKKSDGVGVSLKWGPSSELQITGHAVAEASATLPGRPHASPGPDASPSQNPDRGQGLGSKILLSG